MRYCLDLVYLGAWMAMAPMLCWNALVRKKPVRGLGAKWFGTVPSLSLAPDRPIVWFHGVSVGEIHLLRQVIARFRERLPDWQCIVSTTTATGHQEAAKIFADLPVLYWPFDFTWAVTRALKTIRPTLVVLSEGEMWPNFVETAKAQGVKLAVLNARMSPRSAKRFLAFRGLLARYFAQLDWIGAQNDEYRAHFEALGAPRVVTTGNIKYDGVNSNRHNAKTLAMRTLLGIADDARVWVAGSTQSPEESLVVEIYRRARAKYPNLRLILVPRHPERFDEVSKLLAESGIPFVRRSALQAGAALPPTQGPNDPILLVDTIGELGAIWGLADLAYVGGSLDGKRGGQNMIEPSAFGAAVLFGPHTWNFKQTVSDLLARNAAIQVADGSSLEAAVLRLLDDPSECERLGQAARAFVLSQQGATARTLDEIVKLLKVEVAALAAA